MQKEAILAKLRALKPTLKKRFGIEEIALFGSVARDEAHSDSDIDISILKIRKKDLFLRMEAERFLERELGRRVDLGYFDSMRIFIKKAIQNDITAV